MKQRVISGIVLALILIPIWWFLADTWIFDVFFSLLAAFACFELTRCIKLPSKEMQIVAILFAFVLPLGVVYNAIIPTPAIIVVYIIFLLFMTVIKYPDVKFEHLAGTIYASIIIPLAFAMAPIIQNFYKTYKDIDKAECKFFIWYVVAAALFTDVFAQLSGMAFGKHKMTPELSPKKTWEGAIGGVICALLLNLLWLLIYMKTPIFATNPELPFPIWFYCLLSPIVSIASMFGDLIASLIKRNYDIKDYSNLIPGHGGIMDRFDSVLMVMPMFYALITIYESVVL